MRRGLRIEGTPLEPVIADFKKELEAAGVRRLTPRFYLTTDWVVHDDTIAIGIPFYLARPDLTAARERHLASRAELPASALRLQRGEVAIPTVFEDRATP